MSDRRATNAIARRDIKSARIACNKVVQRVNWLIEAYEGVKSIPQDAQLVCEGAVSLDDLLQVLDKQVRES